MEKNLTPIIRFRGFTEPWKERHFCDLAYRISETSSDVSLPHVEYENIFSGEGRIIDNDALYGDNRTGIKFQIGDVLFGKLRPYLHNDLVAPFNGVAVGDFWVLRSNECTSEFLYSLMSSKHFQRIANISSGSKMPRSDWSLVSFEKFASPIIDEQRKIGIILTSISKAIDSKRNELEKLENVKKACMERMFPREGETTPQLRFKGFTYNWSFSYFGEKIQSHNFRPYIVTPTSCGSHPVIQQGDKSILGYADGIPYEDFKNVVLFGDHTVSLYKPIGPFFIATDGVKILSCKELIGSFFYYVLQRYAPKQEGYKRHFTILQGKRFYFPSLAEQEKIASYFRHLDELIAAKRQEIEKLKDIKQSLLDKMFV